MPRVFLSNFDFEHRLAGVNRRKAFEIASDLSAVWLALAEPEDTIVGLETVDSEFAAELRSIGRVVPSGQSAPGDTLVAWGWDAAAHNTGQIMGCHAVGFDFSVVTTANSRAFSLALEQRFECGLADAVALKSVEDFQLATANASDWIVKAEFSMSSRERIRGHGRAHESHMPWVRKRLDENGVVFFEPYVPITAEAGAQFEIDASGDVELLGVTGLLTTAGGQFAGCGVTGSDADWTEEVAVARLAVEAVRDLGYVGPVGVDMARYHWNGEVRSRPIQDLNARYTMGRLALGFRDTLTENQHAAWLFLPWTRNGSAAETLRAIRGDLVPGVKAIRTSPFTIDDRPVGLGTVLLVADDAANLQSACESARRECSRM